MSEDFTCQTCVLQMPRAHVRKGDHWHWNNFPVENRESHSFRRSGGLLVARLSLCSRKLSPPMLRGGSMGRLRNIAAVHKLSFKVCPPSWSHSEVNRPLAPPSIRWRVGAAVHLVSNRADQSNPKPCDKSPGSRRNGM